MTMISEAIEWKALKQHAKVAKQWELKKLFTEDSKRFQTFSKEHDGILLDLSKNFLTKGTIDLLIKLAERTQLRQHIDGLFRGESANFTENRAALHTALRADVNTLPTNLRETIAETLDQLNGLSEKIRQGRWLGAGGQAITDIVNLGIGGSSTGPELAIKALKPFCNSSLRFHFIDNIDGQLLSDTLSYLNPETTLFLLTSKSFTSYETLHNAEEVKRWLSDYFSEKALLANHFIGITSNIETALAFGLPREHVLPIGEWVGGRYSLWSAVGLPLLLAIGFEQFQAMLKGACSIDQHFLSAPIEENIPILLGLLGVWYTNFWNAQSHAILPYHAYLKDLPVYLQQLEMESNGKQINYLGEQVDYSTAPIIWGGVGTSAQHTFCQLLHQGTQFIPTDFILFAKAQHQLTENHVALIANGLSQSLALMQGLSAETVQENLKQQGVDEKIIKSLTPHKIIPGNRPSTTLLFPELNPYYFGALLALYEHKVFTQACIWEINPFDQWGVELGKTHATKILPYLDNKATESNYDASTNGLIKKFLTVI